MTLALAATATGPPSEVDSARTDTTDNAMVAALTDRRRPSVNSKGEEDESLPTLILRAAQCCLHLLATLNNFNPPGVSGVSLTLHMGIGEPARPKDGERASPSPIF